VSSSAWRQIEALFHEASGLPAPEQAVFLARSCGADPAVRAEVESLLEADRRAAGFLGLPAVAATPTPPPASLVGRRVGQYRVEAKLGEGGMSTVYLAVRADDAYQKKVALKVLGWGADRSDLSARFRAERQILASLDHPGIARLLDGGATDDGRPYLVMEHIQGVPIDRYCETLGLGLDARIDLFREVCSAVQYAHQNLVVHRDIKPSNILVDARGVPCLLDFGIAKLLEGAEVPGNIEATVTGQRLMTPQYASPEQMEGGAITTATDVYSLGVLLYVLLTGHLPYRATASGSDALRRAVVEQDPQRPSTDASRSAQLRRTLRGDLDNIVLMALRKEPGRRYASVALLSEDLRRYRQGLPVTAQPDTLRYRARKFVGRHKAAVAAAALGLAMILGLAGTMTVQATRLARQRDEIRAERDKAVKLTRLLEQVFAGSDPAEARGETLTAREILDKGAARAMDELKDQPEAQAALALVMGRAYQNLGMKERAQPLLQRSLALRRALPQSDPAVAESLLAVAALDQDRGEFVAAEAGQREALDILRRVSGEGDPGFADALNDLSATLIARAKYPEAESVLRQALTIHRKAHGDVHQTVAGDLSNLGAVLRKMGRLPQAEASHREALAIGRAVFGPVHPKLARQVNNLAVVLKDQDRLAEAESLAREALGLTRKLYGGEHPDIALQLSNLASILQARGAYEEAVAVARQGLAMRRALFGPDHEQVAMSLGNLGDLLEEKGDLEAAVPLNEEALRIQRKALGAEHPRCAVALTHLADIALARGALGKAESLAREGLEIRRKVLGENHADYGTSLLTLGSIRLAVHPGQEAEDLLRRGLAVLAKALPPGHWRVAEAESRLGESLSARQKSVEAEPLLIDGYEGLLRGRGPRSARTVAALRRLVSFHEGQGKAGAAAANRATLASPKSEPKRSFPPESLASGAGNRAR
jgi:serine/threonine-protein kinase